MSRSLILSLVFIIALTFMVSCSGGDENMIAPTPTDRDTVATPTSGATTFSGLWQISLDPATGTGDIVQLRSAEKIINVLGFMEPPPLTLMDLDWPDLVIDDPPGTAEVGVILQHPIAGDAVFNGFDVRGVCFGPKVTNADGLTIIPSPEFFSGVPFGYQDGLLGAPDSTGNFEGLAGYKYFCDDLGPVEDLATFFADTGNIANRGLFSSGETNQRDYLLDWNGTGYGLLVFNYAIYANYDWPVGDPPINLDSFEITTANSAEAFCYSVTELANSLYYAEGFGGGGSISLQVEVWDWQGNITNVTIESIESGIIAETSYDVALGAYPNGYSYGFEFYAAAGVPTTTGDLDILITATDTATFGESWFLDMLEPGNSMFNVEVYNCWIYTTTVIPCPPAVVTDFSPDYMGQAEFTSTITGTFMDGSSLGASLTKTGESDIVGTDVTFVDATEITADFDTSSAAAGLWDVEVTNGCGTPGSAVEVIEIWSCGTMSPFITSNYFTGSTYTTSPYYAGPLTATRSGNTYIVGRAYSYAYYLSARDASGIQGPGTIYNVNYSIANGMACTSTNRVYFTHSQNNYNQVRYIQWTGTGWSGYSSMTALPSPWVCYRIMVDDDDNPIVFARNSTNSSLARIYHWNGSSWGSGVDIPTTVHGSSYSYIRAFDWNPVLQHYVFVTRKPSTYYTDLYAVDTNGDLIYSEIDVFSTNHTYQWFPGIYIDQDDPQCHVMVYGGYPTSSTSARPIHRYDAVYGNKTVGSTGTGGSYYRMPGYGDYTAWANDTNRIFCRSYSFYICTITTPTGW